MYFVYISECTNLLLPLPTFIPTRSALPDPAAMVGRTSSADFIILAPSVHTNASIDLNHVPLAPILDDRKETPVAGGSGPTSTVFCDHYHEGPRSQDERADFRLGKDGRCWHEGRGRLELGIAQVCSRRSESWFRRPVFEVLRCPVRSPFVAYPA